MYLKMIKAALPYFLLCMAALFWAGNFIAGRAVHATISPLDLVFARWAVAGLAITLAAFPILRKQWRLLLEHWRQLLFLGVTGLGGFCYMVYRALQETTAINASIFLSLVPLAILFISWALFRKKIRKAQLAGAVISLAGAVTVVIHGDLQHLADFQFNTGDLWMILSIPFWAIYTIQVQRMPPALHPASILAGSIYAGLLLLLPFQLYQLPSSHHLLFSGPNTLAILYIGLFASVGAFFAWNKGVATLGANRAGIFFHLIPVFAAILSSLLLAEEFHVFHALGIALVLTGVFLFSREREAVSEDRGGHLPPDAELEQYSPSPEQ